MNRFELSIATTRKGVSKKAVAELKGVHLEEARVQLVHDIVYGQSVSISHQLESAPTRNEKAIKPKRRL